MKRFFYFLLFITCFGLDRITKILALDGFFNSFNVGNFLTAHLEFNRGISWGFFHSESQNIFILVSAVIFLTICFLAWNLNIKHKLKNNETIFAEILILSGAVSNFMDRIIYGGVIDFILLSYKGWSWPVFNIADMCVVFGVFILFKESFRMNELPFFMRKIK